MQTEAGEQTRITHRGVFSVSTHENWSFLVRKLEFPHEKTDMKLGRISKTDTKCQILMMCLPCR